MTLAQLDVGAFGSPDGPGGDRVPPQDVHAEQSVLGGMLLSKDAIGDVAEVIKSTDFYRPAHELIYDAVIDLFSKGEPVDAITVADEMTKRGTLQRAGGQAYLHDLIQAVPTAANAGYYAQIVAERALLRRLVEAGTKIVQLGYGQGEGDVEEIVNRAQAEVYAVADKRGSEDYVRLGLTLEDTLNEIEVASGRTDEMTGVPTGFTELDELLHGLHKGQMIVVAARPAVGKALALDTPLPTPTGWTTMGEVAVGDLLLDASGRPTRVTNATEIMTGRPCFEVEFSDGAVLVADAEHQWLTHTRASRRAGVPKATVHTTAQIAATLRTSNREARLNHSVALAEPLNLPELELPLSPYVVGAWLGDGTSDAASITTADPEIVMMLEAEGLVVTPLKATMRFGLALPRSAPARRKCVVCGADFLPATSQIKTCGRSCGGRSRNTPRMPAPTCPDCGRPCTGLERCAACRIDHGTVKGLLRGLGILGDKHIPSAYLRASRSQRLALLAGLLDTDGTVTQSGCVQFTTTSDRLRNDVEELLSSLGLRFGVSRKAVRGRSVESSTGFTITFASDEDLFWLPRKALLHKERRGRTFQRRDSRFIVAVRPIESVAVRCVEVDNADHLYLAGRHMVPTHNSTFGMDIARTASIKHGLPAAFFSLEMSRTEISMRVLAAEGSMSLQDLRKGTIGDTGWQKLAKVVTRIEHAPLYIDDSPNMSLMEIRAKCRRLRQQHGLKLVVIDYLQLMSSGKKVESRQQEVSEFSRALKLLAKELEVPVIAISQLNRGPEQRTDKRPQMSDLRESGCLTADTRILRADTGAEVSLGELHASGERDVEVWALDEGLRAVRRTMTHVFSTGIAPVFRLTLASGKTVRATENHPFLTYDGWQPLAALRTGARVAVPRHVFAPRALAEWDDARVSELATDVASGVEELPAEASSLPKQQIALLLSTLFASAGSVAVDVDGSGGRIGLTVCRATADAVTRLLLRFGIQTHIDAAQAGSVNLTIDGIDSQRRFLQEIGLGSRDRAAQASLLSAVRAERADSELDGVGKTLWQNVSATLGDFPTSVPATGAAGGAAVLTRLTELLDTADLDLSAVNDVFWDEVVAVEPAGIEEVFDATVPGVHNFIADGVAVHNSIEQDADVVILLHKDKEREGEADVLVVKHRNGPTKDLVLGFQGHYARFANMAANAGF